MYKFTSKLKSTKSLEWSFSMSCRTLLVSVAIVSMSTVVPTLCGESVASLDPEEVVK